MRKRIYILSALAAFSLLFASFALGKTKPYYSGDAAVFNNNLYVATSNTGDFELFVLLGNKLERKQAIVSDDVLYKKFLDVKLNAEADRLYAYAVNGRYIYKYDVTDFNSIILKNKVKDNSWDWFSAVGTFDGRIYTVGSKGLKIWNYDLVVIDSFNVAGNNLAYNISFSPDGDFIINADGADKKLEIYDTRTRSLFSQADIFVSENNNRKVFSDAEDVLYVVDDKALKAVSLGGEVLREFKHTSNLGHDAAGIPENRYVYFSDGLGVVKVDKSDFKPVDWAETLKLGGEGVNWAMGLSVVKQNGRDRIIIFNNSSIVVMDEKLDPIDVYEAREKEELSRENLFLGADKNRAAPGSSISLHGGGFGPNEPLEINFAGQKSSAAADSSGRFQKIIGVPAVPSKTVDVKVIGQITGLTYSMSFMAE